MQHAPQDLLQADVEQADAMMLLDYLSKRNTPEPLTLLEALEAVHRRQGPTINTFDERHMLTVINRLLLANVPVSIGSPVKAINFTQAVKRLESLPHLPVRSLSN